MKLPPETRIHPGPPRALDDRPRSGSATRSCASGAASTRRARSRARSAPPTPSERDEATLILWAPDYDGGNKAWVRFGDGSDAIVGGSQVKREG